MVFVYFQVVRVKWLHGSRSSVWSVATCKWCLRIFRLSGLNGFTEKMKKEEDHKFKLMDYGGDWTRCVTSFVYSVLEKGLNNRVDSIVLKPLESTVVGWTEPVQCFWSIGLVPSIDFDCILFFVSVEFISFLRNNWNVVFLYQFVLIFESIRFQNYPA